MFHIFTKTSCGQLPKLEPTVISQLMKPNQRVLKRVSSKHCYISISPLRTHDSKETEFYKTLNRSYLP